MDDVLSNNSINDDFKLRTSFLKVVADRMFRLKLSRSPLRVNLVNFKAIQFCSVRSDHAGRRCLEYTCYQTDFTSGEREKESAKHAEYTAKLLMLGQSC